MNARKEASIFSGVRHGALWSAVYNIPSSSTEFLYAAYEPLALVVTCRSDLQKFDLHFTLAALNYKYSSMQSHGNCKVMAVPAPRKVV